MTDIDALLRSAAAGPARELQPDPLVIVDLLRSGRRRRRRRGAAATAGAALLLGSVAVGTTALVRSDSSKETIRYASFPVFPSAAPGPGRVTAIQPDGGAGGASVDATVVAEDAAAQQTVYRYDDAGRQCLKLTAPMSGSTECGREFPADGVTFQGAGPVRNAAGTALSAPAVFGTVPRAATTVVVTGKNGTTDRVRAVDGGRYATNFYLSHFDPVGGVASVTAYSAQREEVGRWVPPASADQAPQADPLSILVAGDVQVVGGPAPGAGAPISGQVEVFRGPVVSGAPVATTVADDAGRFRVGLKPGTYTFVTVAGRTQYGLACSPTTVEISASTASVAVRCQIP